MEKMMAAETGVGTNTDRRGKGRGRLSFSAYDFLHLNFTNLSERNR